MTVLHEARIICPTCYNDGTPMPHVVKKLHRRLVSAFGGATETTGSGHFFDQTEPVLIFDVALEEKDNKALLTIAAWLKNAAVQDCIYIRDFYGNVQFV